jgi:hypothetical protein
MKNSNTIKGRRPESERVSFSNHLKNEIQESQLKINEINKTYKFYTDYEKISNELVLPQDICEDNIVKELELNCRLKRDSKLERIIESLLEENQKFSIFDYFKQKCRNNSKRIILYGFALKNLSDILDIKNHLRNHLELNLIKEVLFDEFQLKIFNTISPVIGFKLMFEDHLHQTINLSEYNRIEFNDFYDFVKKILTRRNLVDTIILEFIKKQIIYHA